MIHQTSQDRLYYPTKARVVRRTLMSESHRSVAPGSIGSLSGLARSYALFAAQCLYLLRALSPLLLVPTLAVWAV